MLGRVVLSLSDGLGERLLESGARTATFLESVSRYLDGDIQGLARIAMMNKVADLERY